MEIVQPHWAKYAKLQRFLNVRVTLRSLRGQPPLTDPVEGVLAKGYYKALAASRAGAAAGGAASGTAAAGGGAAGQRVEFSATAGA